MNEKMKILEMLERGQITAQEASSMLAAAEGGKSPEPPRSDGYRGAPNSQTPPRPSGSRDGGYRDSGSRDGTFMEDMGKKFDTFMRDMEPRARRLAESAAKVTAGAADKIRQQIYSGEPTERYERPERRYEPPRPAPPPRPAQPPRSDYAPPRSPSDHIELNEEIRVKESGAELSLFAMNGGVSVKGYNGDKITARITVKPRRRDARVELAKLGLKYFLRYEADDFESVSVDAYVPEDMFDVVRCEAENGAIELSGVKARMFKAETQNGALKLRNLTSEMGAFEAYNGNVAADNCDVRQCKFLADNGWLTVAADGLRAFDDYAWQLEAANGKVETYLPAARDVGYHVKAQASLGEVNVNLTGVNYIVNERNRAEIQSFSYDPAAKTARITAETSNASVIIN